PIQLGAGYEFNSLLQEISSRSRDGESNAELKARHASVLSLIEGALVGKPERTAFAGALVVFRSGPPGSAPQVGDNVVSIAEVAGGEEARLQLERARREAEAGRVEVRSLEGQLEEARREAQRSRNEADVARQESSDARDALAVSQRGAEEARRERDDARRVMDEVRSAAEAARIRSEEAQREADSLRAQLREARESVRGMAGRADDELAEAREQAALAMRELADVRADAARNEGEVAPLRERYQAAQRELGMLRADLESAQAAAAERETLGERRAAELERLRAELEERTAEVAAAQRQVEQLRGGFDARGQDMAGMREELEGRTAEVAAVRADLERTREELEISRTGSGNTPENRHDELADVKEQLARMHAAFARAPMGGALVAPDGHYIEVSEALCEVLGYRRERLLSGEPPAIVHPEDQPAYRDLARRMVAGEQAGARGYRRYVRADGQTVNMREAVSLVRDAEGRPTMFVLQLEEDQGPDQPVPAVASDDGPVSHAMAEGDEPADALSAAAMRHALEDDLFQLHCQPVLDLRTGTVAQYELLIRMTGEDGRLILPHAFLGTARRAGLAHAIDRWVVRKAIRLLHETALAGDPVSLEVNLSPEAVHDAELPVMIDQELADTPIDPARLVLEVTGATAAENLEETRALAKRLRGLGCKFALDDFRSNFGSFSLLRDLPLDYLKLDGELVGSLAESRTSQLIVKALVDVAAGAGMKTVAVFVSDEETLKLLREQGVDYAQGYTVGRPRPVEAVLSGPRQARALPEG
ncbi:MAG: hypothetical protein QOC95_1017, partial [Thermoleophilaceae bacterium]|nr:hypothetical protein [Thermoleophilaceae bacterium]